MAKNLVGVKEITGYTRRSWDTISVWIECRSFPAKKIDGVWESMTDLIDDWKAKAITESTICTLSIAKFTFTTTPPLDTTKENG